MKSFVLLLLLVVTTQAQVAGRLGLGIPIDFRTSTVSPHYHPTSLLLSESFENASQVFLGYANDGVDDSGPEMTFLVDYVLIDDVAIPNYP